MWDLEDASYDLKYNVDKKSIVIPIQNGIDSEKILCKTLGNNHVVGGLAHISSKISKPGVIDHNGKLAKLIFGVIKENKSRSTLASIEKFKKLCLKANIYTHISGNISLDLRKKGLNHVNSSRKGDLLVRINIKILSNMSSNTKNILKSLKEELGDKVVFTKIK